MGIDRVLDRVRSGNAWLGGLSWFGLHNVGLEPNPTYSATIPLQAHAMFQGCSRSSPRPHLGRDRGADAVPGLRRLPHPVGDADLRSTGALGVGLRRLAAEAGRARFRGGTVVHISAGVSASSRAWFLGPRRDYRRVPIAPHNVPLVLLGAGLLWFGWFGFNAGSALAANGLAALAFVNTNTAAAAALVTWAARPRTHRQITAVGAATGLVWASWLSRRQRDT